MEQYDYFQSGNTFYRIGVRNTSFVIDIVLLPPAWGGVENTDWRNIWKSTY